MKKFHPLLGRARRAIVTVKRFHGETDRHCTVSIDSPNEFHRGVVIGKESARSNPLSFEFVWCGTKKRSKLVVKVIHEITDDAWSH
jgi:hypothetical protein